ncbi:MAG: hypothetical protein ABEI52_07825, partial [Halobacteriaceae archaeon]
TGLKAFFGLPRPPASYHVITADGYGFPSGHATAASITWLTLAVHGSFSTRQRRTVMALVIFGVRSLVDSRSELVVATLIIGGALVYFGVLIAFDDRLRTQLSDLRNMDIQS